MQVQTAAPNRNITFSNNICRLAQASLAPVVEVRTMQATLPAYTPTAVLPNSSGCASGRRIMLSEMTTTNGILSESIFGEGGVDAGSSVNARRSLLQTSLPFITAARNLPGSASKAPDGSCPVFPSNSPWQQDISQMPVHSRSTSIKWHIGERNEFESSLQLGTKHGLVQSKSACVMRTLFWIVLCKLNL